MSLKDLMAKYSNGTIRPIENKEEPIQFYVNKMPNNCFDCPCLDTSKELKCVLSIDQNNFMNKCPLKLVEDYKKEKDYEK